MRTWFMRCQFYRSLRGHFLNLSILILSGLILFACAVVPQPSVDIFIEAVEGKGDSKIDPVSGAVTIIQKGVAVTIEPLDEVEIYALTDNPHINPYVVVGNRGNVEPLYTIFDLTVLNIDAQRVLVNESATLIDKNGAQYANLPYAFFKDLYENIDKSEYDTNQHSRYPYYYSHYPRYHSYLDVESLEEGHAIVAETLFESGKLFKGAKKRGLMVFDRLHRDTTDMRVIVSDIRIVDSDGKEEKLQFNFDFRQVVAED